MAVCRELGRVGTGRICKVERDGWISNESAGGHDGDGWNGRHAMTRYLDADASLTPMSPLGIVSARRKAVSTVK
jgi:hypothetical protein